MDKQELKQYTVYVSGNTYYLRRKGCRALQPATFKARNGPCSDTCFSNRRWHLELAWPNLKGMAVVGTFDEYDDAYNCIGNHFVASGNHTYPSRVG